MTLISTTKIWLISRMIELDVALYLLLIAGKLYVDTIVKLKECSSHVEFTLLFLL